MDTTNTSIKPGSRVYIEARHGYGLVIEETDSYAEDYAPTFVAQTKYRVYMTSGPDEGIVIRAEDWEMRVDERDAAP